MNKEKILWGIAIVAFVLSAVSTVRLLPIKGNGGFGAVGNLLAEQYIPYVLYNGGYNSAKDLTISGATTLSGTVAISGATSLTSTFKLGSSGTALSNMNAGLCYIFPYAATITASSTATVDCQANSAAGTAGVITALTGVQANDFVQATLSTTTAGTTYATSLVLIGAGASTTSGYITLKIRNDGGTYTWPITTNASGTAYFISSRP